MALSPCTPGFPSINRSIFVFHLHSSRFLQRPLEKLQALDLARRMPQLQGALLLRFPSSKWLCERRKESVSDNYMAAVHLFRTRRPCALGMVFRLHHLLPRPPHLATDWMSWLW